MKPRCAVEGLADKIFRSHVEGLIAGKDYDPERSGAEWWTLFLDSSDENSEDDSLDGKIDKTKKTHDKDLKEDDNESQVSTEQKDDDSSDDEEDEDDEVGFHFDADYALEQQLPNYMLHPRIATVTYLSDIGVPTLVLNKRSPKPSDVTKSSLKGNISNGWLSYPEFGKHIAFDGRLLHGAPGTFFPSINFNKPKLQQENDYRSSKRMRLENGSSVHANSTEGTFGKRISFMVNIWLNHCPVDAEILDDETCAKMKTLWVDESPNRDNCQKKDRSEAKQNGMSAVQWNMLSVDQPKKLLEKCLIATTTKSEGARSQQVVICNREVDIHLYASKNDCGIISRQAFQANGRSISISFGKDTLNLDVGAEVIDSDDEED